MSRMIQSRIVEVLPGTQQYFIYGQVLLTDYDVDLELIFDGDLIIENLVLETVLDAGASIQAGPLKLIYHSGHEQEISSSTSDYTMNQNNDDRKMWYTIPAWTKLRWTPYNQYSADVMIAMSAIGRGI